MENPQANIEVASPDLYTHHITVLGHLRNRQTREIETTVAIRSTRTADQIVWYDFGTLSKPEAAKNVEYTQYGCETFADYQSARNAALQIYRR